jgi:hypothetical protein
VAADYSLRFLGVWMDLVRLSTAWVPRARTHDGQAGENTVSGVPEL